VKGGCLGRGQNGVGWSFLTCLMRMGFGPGHAVALMSTPVPRNRSSLSLSLGSRTDIVKLGDYLFRNQEMRAQ